MATEAFKCTVEHRMDAENSFAATFNQGANTGSLSWTTTADLGGTGAMTITAQAGLDADSLKTMPKITVEKEFGADI